MRHGACHDWFPWIWEVGPRRLGPQPPGVRLEPRIAHGGIIGEILAKGKYVSSLSVGNYIQFLGKSYEQLPQGYPKWV